MGEGRGQQGAQKTHAIQFRKGSKSSRGYGDEPSDLEAKRAFLKMGMPEGGITKGGISSNIKQEMDLHLGP